MSDYKKAYHLACDARERHYLDFRKAIDVRLLELNESHDIDYSNLLRFIRSQLCRGWHPNSMDFDAACADAVRVGIESGIGHLKQLIKQGNKFAPALTTEVASKFTTIFLDFVETSPSQFVECTQACAAIPVLSSPHPSFRRPKSEGQRGELRKLLKTLKVGTKHPWAAGGNLGRADFNDPLGRFCFNLIEQIESFQNEFFTPKMLRKLSPAGKAARELPPPSHESAAEWANAANLWVRGSYSDANLIKQLWPIVKSKGYQNRKVSRILEKIEEKVFSFCRYCREGKKG